MSNVIMTSNGSYFPFDKPETHDYDIDEIAHALSHLCRFTGHVKTFYSVAQHSVWVSRMLPPSLALAGLMHDASEAYLGDVASPLKRLLPDYKLIEQRVEKAIAEHFDLPFPLPEAVKQADLRMLMTEKRSLLPTQPGDDANWPPLKPFDFDVVPVGPVEAQVLFLQRFRELTEEPVLEEAQAEDAQSEKVLISTKVGDTCVMPLAGTFVAQLTKGDWGGSCKGCAAECDGDLCDALPDCQSIIWVKKD